MMLHWVKNFRRDTWDLISVLPDGTRVTHYMVSDEAVATAVSLGAVASAVYARCGSVPPPLERFVPQLYHELDIEPGNRCELDIEYHREIARRLGARYLYTAHPADVAADNAATRRDMPGHECVHGNQAPYCTICRDRRFRATNPYTGLSFLAAVNDEDDDSWAYDGEDAARWIPGQENL
jgi:hypothetical protein